MRHLLLCAIVLTATTVLFAAPPLEADDKANCGAIANSDLRYFCQGNCGAISDSDLRYLCQNNCGAIRDADLRYFCPGRKKVPR